MSDNFSISILEPVSEDMATLHRNDPDAQGRPKSGPDDNVYTYNNAYDSEEELESESDKEELYESKAGKILTRKKALRNIHKEARGMYDIPGQHSHSGTLDERDFESMDRSGFGHRSNMDLPEDKPPINISRKDTVMPHYIEDEVDYTNFFTFLNTGMFENMKRAKRKQRLKRIKSISKISSSIPIKRAGTDFGDWKFLQDIAALEEYIVGVFKNQIRTNALYGKVIYGGHETEDGKLYGNPSKISFRSGLRDRVSELGDGPFLIKKKIHVRVKGKIDSSGGFASPTVLDELHFHIMKATAHIADDENTSSAPFDPGNSEKNSRFDAFRIKFLGDIGHTWYAANLANKTFGCVEDPSITSKDECIAAGTCTIEAAGGGSSETTKVSSEGECEGTFKANTWNEKPDLSESYYGIGYSSSALARLQNKIEWSGGFSKNRVLAAFGGRMVEESDFNAFASSFAIPTPTETSTAYGEEDTALKRYTHFIETYDGAFIESFQEKFKALMQEYFNKAKAVIGAKKGTIVNVTYGALKDRLSAAGVSSTHIKANKKLLTAIARDFNKIFSKTYSDLREALKDVKFADPSEVEVQYADWTENTRSKTVILGTGGAAKSNQVNYSIYQGKVSNTVGDEYTIKVTEDIVLSGKFTDEEIKAAGLDSNKTYVWSLTDNEWKESSKDDLNRYSIWVTDSVKSELNKGRKNNWLDINKSDFAKLGISTSDIPSFEDLSSKRGGISAGTYSDWKRTMDAEGRYIYYKLVEHAENSFYQVVAPFSDAGEYLYAEKLSDVTSPSEINKAEAESFFGNVEGWPDWTSLTTSWGTKKKRNRGNRSYDGTGGMPNYPSSTKVFNYSEQTEAVQKILYHDKDGDGIPEEQINKSLVDGQWWGGTTQAWKDYFKRENTGSGSSNAPEVGTGKPIDSPQKALDYLNDYAKQKSSASNLTLPERRVKDEDLKLPERRRTPSGQQGYMGRSQDRYRVEDPIGDMPSGRANSPVFVSQRGGATLYFPYGRDSRTYDSGRDYGLIGAPTQPSGRTDSPSRSRRTRRDSRNRRYENLKLPERTDSSPSEQVSVAPSRPETKRRTMPKPAIENIVFSSDKSNNYYLEIKKAKKKK